jgi:hypothetical protein
LKTNVFLVSLFGIAACGGAVRSEDAGSDAAPDHRGVDARAADAPPNADIAYAGQLVASRRVSGTTATSSVDVFFWEQYPTSTGPFCGRDPVTVGSCCAGTTVIATPVPSTVQLSAGDVTVSDRGAPVATLRAPDYAGVNAPWDPGDMLAVSAPGGNVAAFAGSLMTPVDIAGVTPAFDSPPVSIPSVGDFAVAWTPDGRDDVKMRVLIEGLGASTSVAITCEVPDASGAVVVDASLIARVPASAKGGIHLIRSIMSNASGANVEVSLIGETWLDALATFP